VHTLIALPKRTLSRFDGAQAENQEDSFELQGHADDNPRPPKSPRRAIITRSAAATQRTASGRGGQMRSNNFATDQHVFRTVQTQTLKASPSIDSFKSALSTQQSLDDSCISDDVKAIKNVLHALKTAIDNLSVLIKKRLHKVNDIWREAISLQQSLEYHERSIIRMHQLNCNNLGPAYVSIFNSSETCEYPNLVFHYILPQIWEMVFLSQAMLRIVAYFTRFVLH
jgi:hypothetical protein